jgi:hypothetical protein
VTASSGVVDLDLSGLALRLSGADDGIEASVVAHWGAFLARGATGPPWIDVAVVPSERPLLARPTMRPSLTGEVRPEGARFTSDEGSIEIGADGRAQATIGTGDPAWRFWGLANLLAAAIAYRLPSRPGALLHAAGIVLDGRAFLLVGAAGTGKSTWARLARAAGARVVSDDAVVLDAASGQVELLGTPVRSHEAHPGGVGRWPVAAILHARWGSPPRLAPVTPLEVQARLAANLLYLATGWGRDPRLEAAVDALAGGVPHRELTFSPDPSFVALLRA